MTEHVVNLYMHEIAMHVDYDKEEFRPPFSEDALRTLDSDSAHVPALTPIRIEALSACLNAIDGVFETFLKFDVETIRCLPVSNFVRVAYAVVVLIKMYFAAATPNSELGKVINKNNMKVEQYLDGLVASFQAAAADEKSRPSAKFLMVLIMLKSWFNRQREAKPGTTVSIEAAPTTIIPHEAPPEANSDTTQSSMPLRNGQQSSYSPANTPLQLLSEVATGNSGGQSRSGSVSQYPNQNEWIQQPQPQPQPQYQNYPNMNQMPQGYQNINPASNIDPSLGGDYLYPMSDAFEQAWGMTLGGPNDFNSYFSDEGLYAFIDGVGPGATGFEGM